MLDMFGNEIHLADEGLYAFVNGSSAIIHRVVVIGMTPQRVRVQRIPNIPGERVYERVSLVHPTSLLMKP